MAALRSPHVPSRSLPFPLDKVTLGEPLERIHQSVARSAGQALVLRSEWRSFPLSENHVPRRSTGHLRPLTRRRLSPGLEQVDLFGDSLGYQAEP